MDYRAAVLVLLLVGTASAQCAVNIPAMNQTMQFFQLIGYPIAFFMMVYMGVKWVMADGPSDRENARRGIIYIIIGVILLRASRQIVYFILCF